MRFGWRGLGDEWGYMIGAETHANDAGRNSAKRRKQVQQSELPWQLERFGAAEHAPNDSILNRDLQSLRGDSGKRTAFLNGPKVFGRRHPDSKFRTENVGGGDGVLNGEIDSNAADGRHSVSSVSNAQQPGTRPILQPVDGDGEKADLIPIVQFLHAITKEGLHIRDLALKGGDAPLANLIGGPFRDNERTLPIGVAIDQDENPSSLGMAEGLLGIIRFAAQAHPHHIHRGADREDFEAGARANDRASTIGSHGEVSADFESSRWSLGLESDDRAILFDQVGDFCIQLKLKSGTFSRVFGDKVEKVPLRHEHEEFAAGWETSEISQDDSFAPDLRGNRL